MTLVVRLFGSLEVVGPGGRLRAEDFPSRKAKQVLALLAVAAGEPVSKERLVDQIWGERLPVDPLGAVEQAVSVLRRALRAISDDPVVLTRGAWYRIDTSVVTVDVDEFDRRIVGAAAVDPSEREAVLTDALALATGDLLAGEPVPPWVEAVRERCRGSVQRAWITVAELALDRGAGEIAVAAAQRARLLSARPLDEAYRIEIDGLLTGGQPHRAGRLLDEFERRLADDGRMPRIDVDSMRLAIAASSHRTGRPVAGVTTTLVEPPGEVPFVGRDHVVDAISVLCGERSAGGVVLVDAPAGTGRTRLLAHVGARADAGARVIRIGCNPGDRIQPLLVAGRLLRAASRVAGVTRMPRIDGVPAAMFGRLAGVLDRIDAPVLLVDDLHRADPGTLAMLAALTAADARLPVLLVATCRRAVAHDLAREFANGSIERIGLRSLLPGDLEAIGLGSAWVETGGHPATLAACCSAARRNGVLDPTEIDVVLDRFVESAPDVRSVVERVAVAGTATHDDLATASGWSRAAVRGAVDAARGDGLARVGDDGGIVLTSDILRRVLAARING